MKKILFITVLALLSSTVWAAAPVYGSGEVSDPVFNTDQPVYPGMRYAEYKNFYDTKFYVPSREDPYSRGWAGVASFFIPGLGQGIDGQWGRAAWIFGVNVALNLAASSQLTIHTVGGQLDHIEYTPLYWVFTGANFMFDIWNVIDAVHIAKVKNMYYQDLRAQRSGVDLKFEPYFTCFPQGSSQLQPAAGLSLVLAF